MTIAKVNASPANWAVVGGGMMGLATALRLAEKGQRVTLLEAASEFGAAQREVQHC